uniref:G-protein coupled receptors family 1 profile domain-containing protein n=1 Tax=Cricetulus griseus TaxID=10029 RepID=A0A8C2M3G3_CRIGR
NMKSENQAVVSGFILLGLTDTEQQLIIFGIFLCLYLVTILETYKNITYAGCLNQVCFVLMSVSLQNCLLAAMAYDCYVTICHPLRYRIIMNPCLCILMVTFSVMGSIANSLVNGLMVLHLSFCTELVIPHFFCELTQITKLACSNTIVDNTIVDNIYIYIYISSEGRYKAFSTCGSHLSVVSLFYRTEFGVYISSTVTESSRKTVVASVLYSVVPQMLNPFIYSLRNRDVKEALKRLISRILSPL